MKKNKGFTIIEIISVLIIITLIATMAIAGISGTKGRIDNKAYNSKIKLIEQAAAIYAKENSEKFKEEFGECKETSGNCDCTDGDCVYKFNTTVEELIELGYYDSELSKECLVENPKDKSKCFDKEPIEIIIDADKEGVEAHFGEEFEPYDIVTPVNTMCEFQIDGQEGEHGWYVGERNRLKLIFKIEESNVARYGISKNNNKTYNSIREIPLSSTTGTTYYGYVKDTDGNEGSCIIKNIKVDSTNPTDPNMSIDSNYNVSFSGSRDTYSERVKYSYTVDGGIPIINTKYIIPSTTTSSEISVHAFDYAGNISNTITKTLLISSPLSGTITEIKTYHCQDGYTCSDNPCKQSSSCIKVEESIPTEKLKYKCSITGEIYNTENEAKQNCKLHESGTVTTITNYTCDDGYTCSDGANCNQNSTCKKTLQEPVISTLTYKCDITGETYESYEKAMTECKKEEAGTTTTLSSYVCQDGYTCSDNPCTQNSTCTKQVDITSPIEDTYYVCYIDGEFIGSYDDLNDANANCKLAIPGEVTTHTSYHCQVGYTCSDGANCNQNSTCIKNVNPQIVDTKYDCYIDNELVATYDELEEAQNDCVIQRNGTVSFNYTYRCPDTYKCSDNPCTQNSTCTKTTSENLITTTQYECYIDGVLTGTYDRNNYSTAVSSCKKTIAHPITPVTKYYCDRGYTCSNNCSSSSSTCTKTETTAPNSTTKYTCSLHTGTLYNSNGAATSACTNTITNSRTRSFVSKCNTTSYKYSWEYHTISDGETSCSSQYVGYECNSNRVGWTQIKCTVTNTKYYWQGYCIKNGVREDITSKFFGTYNACYNDMNNYNCSTPGATFHYPDSCSRKYYYQKETWKCNKNAVKKYGPYECNTSANSTCSGSCDSGYTKTETRNACYDSSVQGNSCSSNKTCTATVTTTCTKTGTVGTKTIYSCPSGYTCSNNCSNSSSTCTKVTTSTLRNKLKYKCSKNNTEYDNENDAKNACKEVIQGNVVTKNTYSCPSGYTCSNNCSNSSSTCTKTETTQTNKIWWYTCSFNNNLYTEMELAQADCVKFEAGSIQEHYIYGCSNGFTCNNSPCTSNSQCSSVDKNKLYGTNTYTCNLNNNTYSSYFAATRACVTIKTGTPTPIHTYGCSSDYECSDGANCNSNSTCIKYDVESTENELSYYCSLTNSFYNSLASAQQACHRLVQGSISEQYVYSCRSGYICNGGGNCSSTSICEKTDVKNPHSTTLHYCSLTDSFYNNNDEAINACTKNTQGDVLDNYVYICDPPATCSDEPCVISSVCRKNTIQNPLFDSVYYCSIDPTKIYTNKVQATIDCSDYCGNGKYNFSNHKCYILE